MKETMKCNSCQHENKREANFCENCGNSFAEVNDLDVNFMPRGQSDKLIFVGVMVLCGTAIYHFLVRFIIESIGDWDLYETIKPLTFIILAIGGSAALSIAFGMKMGRLKILALIFASVYALIQLYWIVEQLTR